MHCHKLILDNQNSLPLKWLKGQLASSPLLAITGLLLLLLLLLQPTAGLGLAVCCSVRAAGSLH